MTATEADRMLAWDTPHPNLMFDLRMERYSQYLHDGDFERFMPATAMSKDDPEYQELFIEWLILCNDFTLNNYPKGSYLYDRELCRLMWIRQRFNEFLGPEWRELNRHTDEWYTRITLHPECDDLWENQEC